MATFKPRCLQTNVTGYVFWHMDVTASRRELAMLRLALAQPPLTDRHTSGDEGTETNIPTEN